MESARRGIEASRPVLMLPVQELAAHGDVPARYVARAHDEPPGTAVTAVAPVPVIDLGRLCGPDGAGAAADEAAKLRLALESWGLFLVANHGIDAALMDAMVGASREFFRQPLEEKQKHSNMADGKNFQLEGYGNDQVRSEDQVLDWCDRLYLKVEPQDQRNLALWPQHPKAFRLPPWVAVLASNCVQPRNPPVGICVPGDP